MWQKLNNKNNNNKVIFKIGYALHARDQKNSYQNDLDPILNQKKFKEGWDFK